MHDLLEKHLNEKLQANVIVNPKMLEHSFKNDQLSQADKEL